MVVSFSCVSTYLHLMVALFSYQIIILSYLVPSWNSIRGRNRVDGPWNGKVASVSVHFRHKNTEQEQRTSKARHIHTYMHSWWQIPNTFCPSFLPMTQLHFFSARLSCRNTTFHSETASRTSSKTCCSEHFSRHFDSRYTSPWCFFLFALGASVSHLLPSGR